ncbi:MAG: winged helix-turn-helix domain-containing protein [Nitrososphaerales archaeon]
MGMRNRNGSKHFLEHIVEILTVLRDEPLGPSSFYNRRPVQRIDTFYAYLRFLIKHRLIEKDEGIYRLTETGRKFLEIFS